MKIAFVTGNERKFEEAELILKDYDLERVDIDLPEIQGDPLEVVREKAHIAFNRVQAPVFVEDTAICCDALNGLPGVFVKFFLKAMGREGMVDLVHKYTNHRAHALCSVGLMMPGWKEPEIFQGELQGTIVKARGDLHHGKYSWNPIFQPEGWDQTMGEISMEDHAKISHRRRALEKLQVFLNERS